MAWGHKLFRWTIPNAVDWTLLVLNPEYSFKGMSMVQIQAQMTYFWTKNDSKQSKCFA